MSIKIVLCNRDGEFVKEYEKGVLEITSVPCLAKTYENPYVAEKKVIEINLANKSKFFINFYKTMYVLALDGDRNKLLLDGETETPGKELREVVYNMTFGSNLNLAKSFSLLPDANAHGSKLNSLLAMCEEQKSKGRHVEVVEVESLDNHYGFNDDYLYYPCEEVK